MRHLKSLVPSIVAGNIIKVSGRDDWHIPINIWASLNVKPCMPHFSYDHHFYKYGLLKWITSLHNVSTSTGKKTLMSGCILFGWWYYLKGYCGLGDKWRLLTEIDRWCDKWKCYINQMYSISSSLVLIWYGTSETFHQSLETHFLLLV